MRSFIALPVPDAAVEPIQRLQRQLGFGRTVPRENLHLTLAFLDDQPEEALEDLHWSLHTLKAPAVEVTLHGLRQLNRSICAEVLESDALTRLHADVQSRIRKTGLETPRRKFFPHVTLCRLQKGQSTPPLRAGQSDYDPIGYVATDVALVASTLHPKGAQHDVLALYPLSDTQV